MHYQLRTEGDTPLRTAASVWLGTVVGCTPIYGIHIVICAVLARLLGLSRIKAYLAAHVNNPLTFPGLLYLEFGIGHWLHRGEWPQLTIAELRSIGLISVARDLAVGSLLLGVTLGTVIAAVAYFISARRRPCSLYEKLREETSRRYQDAGILHWEFVRGKLKWDPMCRAILASGLLPRQGKLVDLGCGRGILLALIQSAKELHANGGWTGSLPTPPAHLELFGVEHRAPLARVASLACGNDLSVEVEDLSLHDPKPADVILLLDVLHYLGAEGQDRLIRRIAGRMPHGGILIVRELDAAQGVRFQWIRLGKRLRAMVRLRWRQRFCYRSERSWCELLEGCGLETTVSPPWCETRSGRVLIEARRGQVSHSNIT